MTDLKIRLTHCLRNSIFFYQNTIESGGSEGDLFIAQSRPGPGGGTGPNLYRMSTLTGIGIANMYGGTIGRLPRVWLVLNYPWLASQGTYC